MEHNFVEKIDSTDSDNVISVSAGECLADGVLYSTIDSIPICSATDSNNVGIINECPQDGTMSVMVDTVESAHDNSLTEVMYSEILDVTYTNQVVSDSRLQKYQQLDMLLVKICHNDLLTWIIKGRQC